MIMAVVFGVLFTLMHTSAATDGHDIEGLALDFDLAGLGEPISLHQVQLTLQRVGNDDVVAGHRHARRGSLQ
jgi:hypothetical protein